MVMSLTCVLKAMSLMDGNFLMNKYVYSLRNLKG